MEEDPAKSAARRRLPTDVLARTRYVVGIDLGTTNTAVAYVDRRAGRKARSVRSFDVPQLTEPGIVRACRTLPSALYLRVGHELSPAQASLPWTEGDPWCVVGQLARVQGALVPDLLVTSAKSWLCHPGVDRRGAILPWGAPEDVPRRSPVEVEAEVLRAVRSAWNHEMARDDAELRLEKQDLVVTVPASFDEVARELTVQAVRQAGLDALLIEEPQAALYAWIAAREEAGWTEDVLPGQTILVCDVGGGTTDFSLITVTEGEEGDPGFARTAVGDHLLLGGDNMDLALARRVEDQVGGPLDLRTWNGLVLACRDAKEALLEGRQEVAQLAVAGRGSRLIGNVRRAELTRQDVLEVIVKGFFPDVGGADAALRGRRAGLKELGLPYEDEVGITRHLRAFLVRHGAAAGAGSAGGGPDQELAQRATEGGRPAHVDLVLFNGGVFKTAALRERVLDVIGSWQERPRELPSADLDLAVARGAAYYGLVRRGKGTRIRSGAGRAYYVEVRSPGSRERTALCLIPRGVEEGKVVTIRDHPLELQANRPVAFPFHTSSVRDDEPGDVIAIDRAEVEELAPLHTVIRVGRKRTAHERAVPVELVSRYTELGTLEIWCQAKEGEQRWRLELDTRPARPRGEAPAAEEEGAAEPAAAPADAELPPVAADTVTDPARIARARAALVTALRLAAAEAQPALEGLGKRLEELLGGVREGWPVPVIRALFDGLYEEKEARTRSPVHEARWLNLAGFFLRPGFGATLDPVRVSNMWKVYLGGMAHPNQSNVRIEWFVCWRRLAGGLHRGQQEEVFSLVSPVLLGGAKAKGASRQELAEYWRLAGSLEHLPPKKKRQLGDALLELLEQGKAPPRWGPWALGRLASRVPVYGPLDRLVSVEVCVGWLRRLNKLKLQGEEAAFAYVQLARLTGDRARDVPGELRAQTRAVLVELGADARTLQPLDEVVASEAREQDELFGEALPIGLVLRAEAPSS